jgi:hypothetical protein
MPNTSFAGLISEGEHLLVTTEANAADLAFLEGPRSQLQAALEGAKAASVRQAAFKAQFQQATRDLEKYLSESRDLMTRLRNGVRTQYGLKQEKLAEFGLQPRRKRAPKTTKPPETDPTPPPAPTNQKD